MKKYLGIEFGSTRIKGVLLDEDHVIIARGSYLWENQLVNGIWTYPLSLAFEGLQACYRELKENFRKKTGEKLTHIDAIGISGMMHGYLVFDKDGKQIREFRTWRNTITEEASNILSQAFCFHIPQRWSACHIYQAILNKEEGVKDIAFATTLAGYFHYLLTGEKVLGIGEASGVFPIDGKTRDYHQGMLTKFNALVEKEVPWKLIDILPKILLAGDDAGYLSQQGALLIDPEGDLKPGVPFCPPEGDMGTGMICTNSLRPGTGNASIGTSSNVTIITDAEIGVYPEIDVITTPTGVNAALVHINNGTSEMNVWERLFKEVVGHFAPEVKDGDLYSLMFNAAMKGDKAVKGLYSVDFFSGEPVAEVNEGKLLSIREPDAEMSLTNFMRSHIYSLLAPIRLGVDILTEKEGIKLKKIVGHGGFFKTPKVGEIMLSSAFNVPVLTLVSAGEGGPYGQALLAAYRLEKASGESLEDYLENKVFRHQKANEYQAEEADVRGFESFLKDYKKALEIEKHAIASFSQKKDSALSLLKEEVLRANLRLAEEGLVTLTWGNVSLIDREKGLVVIKPSGVPYEKLKAEDMVVVDLEGHVVEGRLKPSSDTPTHLALYKAFPEISSIVHTHSTYAVSWAQAAKAIPVYGTTHADTFSLPIPCTRDLRKNEIEGDYETNTGKVIAETFQGKDPLAVPGVLVAHHGPFAWGRSAKEAVDHALILEKVAEMAVLTKAIDPESSEVGENLLKKHYKRKHGKNAYYGQGGNHE